MEVRLIVSFLKFVLYLAHYYSVAEVGRSNKETYEICSYSSIIECSWPLKPFLNLHIDLAESKSQALCERKSYILLI